MEIKRKHKDIVLYDQIVEGALLKFGSVDNVDFHLLVDDIEGAGFKVDLESGRDLPLLNKYLEKSKDGTLSLSYIGDDLLKSIPKFNSSILGRYFNSLDVEDFRIRKSKFLRDNGVDILEGANVLFISGNEEDYSAMLKYGFKNVDYFGSIIRASKYFKGHPDMLEKYHLIILEDYLVEMICPEGGVEFTKKLRELSRRKKIDFIKLERKSRMQPYSEIICADFMDFKLNRTWTREEQTIEDVFDRIVESAALNECLSKVSFEDASLPPIEDTRVDELPIPRKKSDIKILWLFGSKDYSERVSKKLGVNIEVFDDADNSLSVAVDGHFGEYDIILANTKPHYWPWSSIAIPKIAYTHGLPANIAHRVSLLATFINEATEQCKDTGRRLVQITTYEPDLYWTVKDGKRTILNYIGTKVELNTIFAGDLANPQEQMNNQTIHIAYMEDVELSESRMQAVIESAISTYEAKLVELGFDSLEDNDLKSTSDIEKTFSERIMQIEETQAQELNSIGEFDSFVSTVLDYLETRKRERLIDPEGIRISENEVGVRVELTNNGGALTFSKDKPSKNLRIFSIQTANTEGILNTPENVGFYDMRFKGLEGTPKMPGDKQMVTISSIYEKVDSSIKPINGKYKPQKKISMEPNKEQQN